MSISEGVGARGSVSIEEIGTEFAVPAAAGACPLLQWVPKQFVPFALTGLFRITVKPSMGSPYCVQLYPNTGSSSSKPPLYVSVSVQ